MLSIAAVPAIAPLAPAASATHASAGETGEFAALFADAGKAAATGNALPDAAAPAPAVAPDRHDIRPVDAPVTADAPPTPARSARLGRVQAPDGAPVQTIPSGIRTEALPVGITLLPSVVATVDTPAPTAKLVSVVRAGRARASDAAAPSPAHAGPRARRGGDPVETAPPTSTDKTVPAVGADDVATVSTCTDEIVPDAAIVTPTASATPIPATPPPTGAGTVPAAPALAAAPLPVPLPPASAVAITPPSTGRANVPPAHAAVVPTPRSPIDRADVSPPTLTGPASTARVLIPAPVRAASAVATAPGSLVRESEPTTTVTLTTPTTAAAMPLFDVGTAKRTHAVLTAPSLAPGAPAQADPASALPHPRQAAPQPPLPQSPALAPVFDTETLLAGRMSTQATRARKADPALVATTPTSEPATAATPPAALAAAETAAAAAPLPPAPALDVARHTAPASSIDRIERLRDAADAVSTSIRLVPDALGAIDVSVRREGEVTHVHLAAEQAATHTLLAAAQPALAEIADQRGIRLGRIEVETGAGGGQPPTQQQSQHQSRQPSVPARTRAASRVARTDPHRIA